MSLSKIPDEKRQTLIKELIDYFDREREEKIGVIAATDLLSFLMDAVGKEMYNLGLNDAKKAMESRIDELRFDLDDLIEE